RPYKITYKTYLNNRLKKIPFHSQETYPLYVQVTYRQKTIFFKSAFFEMFSDTRYCEEGKCPSIEFVIDKEHLLIDYVIKLHEDDFSLERFKTAYDYYSRDLCTSTE